MQRILLRMMTGKLPTVSPTFTDDAYLPSGINIKAHEWAAMLSDVYIWVECAAVPRRAFEASHACALQPPRG
jgi:hypothetical protein